MESLPYVAVTGLCSGITVTRDGFAREQCGAVTNREGSEPRKFSDHKRC